MSHASQSGVEEFSTTLFEKFLALVLAVFILIGSSWIYERLYFPAKDVPQPRLQISNTDDLAVSRSVAAKNKVNAENKRLRALKSSRDDARERYRTQLDAGNNDPVVKQAYDTAEQRVAASEAQVQQLTRAEVQLAPAAEAAQKRIDLAQERAFKLEDREQARVETKASRLSFGARLAYGIALLVGGFVFLRAMQRQQSRWTIVGISIVGAGTLQALWFAGEYLDILNGGALMLSIVGIGLTMAVFMWYQRFLAARVPRRRVRKGQCMFCGFPVGDHAHCEGCGRSAHAACTTCGDRRRVGAAHCGACGAT